MSDYDTCVLDGMNNQLLIVVSLVDTQIGSTGSDALICLYMIDTTKFLIVINTIN